MSELTERAPGLPAGAAAGASFAKAALLVAFAVLTIWIHYEVKFVRARGSGGTVQELGSTKVGAAAPDFSALDLDGREVSLSALRDQKAALLEFWATWCPPCRMVMATLHGMESELRAIGVEVFNMNEREPKDRVRAFVEKEGHDFRVLLDGDGAISDRYGVRSLPTMVLIDKRGIVRWIHVGHLPETGELRDLLHRLAAE